MVKIDIDEIDIYLSTIKDVREYMLTSVLYLASKNVHEAENYLELAIEDTYNVEEYLKKLKHEAVEEIEGDKK